MCRRLLEGQRSGCIFGSFSVFFSPFAKTVGFRDGYGGTGVFGNFTFGMFMSIYSWTRR